MVISKSDGLYGRFVRAQTRIDFSIKVKKKLLFAKDLHWFVVFHYSHITEFNESLYTRTSYVDVHAHGIF